MKPMMMRPLRYHRVLRAVTPPRKRSARPPSRFGDGDRGFGGDVSKFGCVVGRDGRRIDLRQPNSEARCNAELQRHRSRLVRQQRCRGAAAVFYCAY